MAIETNLIHYPSCRIQQGGISHPIFILPSRCLCLDQEVKCGAILEPGISPVLLDWVPELAQALLVRVAILHNEGQQLIGTPQREAVADRSTIIHHVERKLARPSCPTSLSTTFVRLSNVYWNLS